MKQPPFVFLSFSVPPAFVSVGHFNGLEEHAASFFMLVVSRARMLMGCIVQGQEAQKHWPNIALTWTVISD
jgi:hypothetical protein